MENSNNGSQQVSDDVHDTEKKCAAMQGSGDRIEN